MRKKSKKILRLFTVLAAALLMTVCSKNKSDDFSSELLLMLFASSSSDRDPGGVRANTVEFSTDMTEDEIQAAFNQAETSTHFKFGAGTFKFTSTLSVRSNRISITGAGIDRTILDFSGLSSGNGVDVVGNDFRIEDLNIYEAKKDGIRVEDSEYVIMRRVKTEWDVSGVVSEDKNNGIYGLYPVKSSYILMEDCEAYGAADAGIYVGQSRYAVIRNNIAKQNVAGIEIENTADVDVYGNLAEDNTGGLLIFDLPGNPQRGSGVRIYNNTVQNNNRANFGHGGTVALIPAGTGTFVMAADGVELFGNNYENNNSADMAIVSFMATGESHPDGDAGFLTWSPYSKNVYIYGNNFKGGSGDDPDLTEGAGQLIAATYGAMGVSPVANIVYDGIDAPATIAAGSTTAGNNTVSLCVNNSGASFADINWGLQAALLGGGGGASAAAVASFAAGVSPGNFACDHTKMPGVEYLVAIIDI